MLPSISKNDRFISDCNRYKDYISKVSDLGRKEKLNDLYKKFVNAARAIDGYYEDLSSGIGIPANVEQARTTLADLRKELEKYCSSPTSS